MFISSGMVDAGLLPLMGRSAVLEHDVSPARRMQKNSKSNCFFFILFLQLLSRKSMETELKFCVTNCDKLNRKLLIISGLRLSIRDMNVTVLQ